MSTVTYFTANLQPILTAFSHPLPIIFFTIGKVIYGLQQTAQSVGDAALTFRSTTWLVAGQISQSLQNIVSQIPLVNLVVAFFTKTT